jgi:hypothetical protein
VIVKVLILSLVVILLASVALQSQVPGNLRDHPAIAYTTKVPSDPVSKLQGRIQRGEVRLEMDGESGYLRSILQALNVPIESQVAVFSKTSLQGGRIDPQNPRTIFFNDAVAVARPRNGFIELASTDPQQGVIFYSFGQFGRPEFRRDKECLVCHVSPATLRIPGLAIGSVYPRADGEPILDAPTFITDHRSPLEERWGGWYVTGVTGSMEHLGNRVAANPSRPELLARAPTPKLESLRGIVDLTGYLAPYSDIVALMVLEHQAHMTNLITRLGWEWRVAAYEHGVTDAEARSLQKSVNELVDYLLFVDEAPLPNKIQGTSGFAEMFQALGPKDNKGRSLRDLDLVRRLMRYPCSYLIYSAAFDGMPPDAREAIYRRFWQVLSGQEASPRYTRLTINDRRAVLEILQATKKDLPRYFGQITK